MKKVILSLLLVSMSAFPVYAVNVVDTVLCKQVILRANDACILVNRLTGEVKYILRHNGQWALLRGAEKNEYQAMYNAQVYNAQAVARSSAQQP